MVKLESIPEQPRLLQQEWGYQHKRLCQGTRTLSCSWFYRWFWNLSRHGSWWKPSFLLVDRIHHPAELIHRNPAAILTIIRLEKMKKNEDQDTKVICLYLFTILFQWKQKRRKWDQIRVEFFIISVIWPKPFRGFSCGFCWCKDRRASFGVGGVAWRPCGWRWVVWWLGLMWLVNGLGVDCDVFRYVLYFIFF